VLNVLLIGLFHQVMELLDLHQEDGLLAAAVVVLGVTLLVLVEQVVAVRVERPVMDGMEVMLIQEPQTLVVEVVQMHIHLMVMVVLVDQVLLSLDTRHPSK